ncbi:MAG: DUF732 domain-containing protein [Mycobacterium kyogaense]|uniref:DUF732 domain-containing protein n=1 Tax=Mycobacterium kyogaense TaxID=2212479 RepID=UPI002FF63E99
MMIVLTRNVGIATICAIFALLGSTSPAQAEPLDTAFLDRLTKVGITTSTPYMSILYAHDICRQIGSGVPLSRIVSFVLNDNPRMNQKGAEDLAVLAYMTYCPPS